MLLGFLNFPATRNYLTQTVTEQIAHKLGTKVSIESLEIGLFNRLIINNIRIIDQKEKVLLSAERATVKIELRSLLKKELSLRTVSLLDSDLNLYKEAENRPTNFQFIIDAFSSKKKKENALNLRINSLILRRVNLKYDELFKAKTPNQFNKSHIHISQANANISIKKITPDSLNLLVRSFAFKEDSGFELQNLTFRILANRTQAEIKNLRIKLPHTQILQNKLTATYDIRSKWSELWNTLNLKGKIDHSNIATTDFKTFNHKLAEIGLNTELSAKFNITPNHIALKDLKIQDTNNKLYILSDLYISRKERKIYNTQYDFRKIQIKSEFIGNITEMFVKDTIAKHIIRNIGDLNMKASGNYKINQEGQIKAEITTDLGSLNVECQHQNHLLNSKFKINHFNVSKLYNQWKLPSLLTTNGTMAIGLKNNNISTAEGHLTINEIQWNEQTLKDIELNVNYNTNRINAKLNSPNPDLNLSIEGVADLFGKQIKNATLSSDIINLSPDKLGFKNFLGSASYAGTIKACYTPMQGHHYGSLNINDFKMFNGPYGDFKLQHLDAKLTQSKKGDLFKISSDFLDASIDGTTSPIKIVEGIKSILNKCLAQKELSDKTHDNNWKIIAKVKESDIYRKLLGVNFDIISPIYIQGVIGTGNEKTTLSAFSDKLKINNNELIQPSIFIKGTDTQYQCLIKTGKDIAKHRVNLVADLQTINKTLKTQIAWSSNAKQLYDGEVASTTSFSTDKDGTNFNMLIHPSQFSLADSVWNIPSGKICLEKKNVSFDNVSISHANQLLSINGNISPSKSDSVIVNLKNIDIEYILGLVNFHAVDFGGKATGEVVVKQQKKYPELKAKLYIPDFTFNHAYMGETSIKGEWNNQDNRIMLNAHMSKQGNIPYTTDVIGYVSLAERGLCLDIDAQNTDLHFLRRYMDGIFENFEGNATGHVQLYGPFKKLDFKGQLQANAQAEIEATGVTYKVKDGDVVLSPGVFAFNNFRISDKNTGKGTASGKLFHNHLKDLSYEFNIKADHLLCYDLPQSLDMPFYSTTTGSGKVHLQGYPGKFTADIALRPENPTKFTYVLGTPGGLTSEDNTIKIRPLSPNKKKDENADSISPTPPSNSTTDIVLNFLIDCTPAAQLKIITDPRAGDAITAYGQGTMRAIFHNKGSFEMYGTYRVNRGTYKISIQDIIRKELKLKPESYITFSGNPMMADLGLKATYTVNGVSLSDLNYGAGFSQKSAKVDCILNITGKAQAPRVVFDLDFHNISDDEKQMVRQLIATDEDMNRQAIYLLGIGRFYATNTQSSTNDRGSQEQNAAAMRSFLSTTLTGQLNNAISSALGSQSHWSFGTNLTPGTLGWEDVEVDGLLQGRLLNDRLLINGNFGYRDRPTYTSNFVGDFDIRYLLTPKGNISLKAYSETTDRYFTKSSLTTQGVGIMMQRDFNNLKDLFKFKRRKHKKQRKNK